MQVEALLQRISVPVIINEFFFGDQTFLHQELLMERHSPTTGFCISLVLNKFSCASDLTQALLTGGCRSLSCARVRTG